jgi:hypothetical protein
MATSRLAGLLLALPPDVFFAPPPPPPPPLPVAPRFGCRPPPPPLPPAVRELPSGTKAGIYSLAGGTRRYLMSAECIFILRDNPAGQPRRRRPTSHKYLRAWYRIFFIRFTRVWVILQVVAC